MDVVGQVLGLFLFILTGFICAKIRLADRDTTGHFSRLILNVTLPALLLSSFQRPFSGELLHEAGIALGVSALCYGLYFLLAAFYPRLLRMKGPERGVHRYGIIFSNCGFMGYPIVEAILGPSWLFHAVIYNTPFNFLAYSLGAWFISKEGERPLKLSWKTFVNPSVAACFLGFILFVFSISLPGPLQRCVKTLGDMTSPLSMIVIGITLAQAELGQIFGRWQIYVTVLMRLIVLPILTAALCYRLGLRGPLLLMAALITAMPVGSTTSILASLYGAAEEEGSSLVFLSTLLCMVTVPLVVSIVKLLEYRGF